MIRKAGQIGIIDYGMGNLRSVQKAFEQVGAAACVLREPDGVRDVDRLVLPGVGAFADAIARLKSHGWVSPIQRFVAEGRPLLGICLGLQLLFEGSDEDAPSADQPIPGLALLPGRVVRFPLGMRDAEGRALKVPHMGWNTLNWSGEDPLLSGLEPGCAAYFVHSYYAQPTESPGQPVTSATAEHGVRFCATVRRGGLWATQFHPEKSQRVGLRMLANFASI
jgi:glutamine amidotransferase